MQCTNFLTSKGGRRKESLSTPLVSRIINMTSGGNNFKYVPENQLTKFKLCSPPSELPPFYIQLYSSKNIDSRKKNKTTISRQVYSKMAMTAVSLVTRLQITFCPS